VRPPRTPDPSLRASHVFHHHGNMPTSRFARLALKAKARVEQFIQLPLGLACFVSFEGDGLRLPSRPRHRHERIPLTRCAGHDQRSVPELRSVQRPHVLNDKLRRVFVIAVDVPLNVEAYNKVTLGE